MTQDYYRILGVPQDVTVDQIKRAYRAKAKKLHPDVNQSPDAHDRFVALNEAYEYLLLLKTGKIYNASARRYRRRGAKNNVQEEWRKTERAKARQRARENSRKRYSEYLKSDVYQTSVAQATVIEHISLLVSLIFILIPIWSFIAFGKNGLIGGAVLWVMTAPAWSDLFRKKANLKAFQQALVTLSDEREFYWVFLSILNVFLLFSSTLQSVISTLSLIIILALGCLLGFILAKLIHSDDIRLEPTVLSYCIFPLLINLFFLMNGLFSHSPYTETYAYKIHQEWVAGYEGRKGKMESTSLIILEGQKYEGHHWMRSFFNLDKLKRGRRVTYHIEKGGFGIPVLRETVLSP